MGKIANLFSGQSIPLSLQQKTQMLALDKEFEMLESKVTALNAECLKLRAEVNPLKQEIERLKNQIKKSAAHEDELDNVEVKILQTLSSKMGRMIAGAIARQIAMSHTKIEYYLAKLEESGFIHVS